MTKAAGLLLEESDIKMCMQPYKQEETDPTSGN
jgi:hypothetical protein